MRLLSIYALTAAIVCAQPPALDFLNRNHPVLDAHNCYPYEGRWADRIDRALATGFPVAIEQDIAWARGRPVVSHTPKTTGSEPALRDYFFERVRPIVETALAQDDRSHWPLIVLHFDFKSNEREILQAVWDLLGDYESWITTAPLTADPHALAPLIPRPLLVLTEDSDAQEAVFFRPLKTGAKLRLFGSAHSAAIQAQSQEQRNRRLVATMPAEQLLTERPTNYRRWWNNSWYAVEEGGQPRAGDWTAASAARLRALVNYAHKLGYWIRFDRRRDSLENGGADPLVRSRPPGRLLAPVHKGRRGRRPRTRGSAPPDFHPPLRAAAHVHSSRRSFARHELPRVRRVIAPNNCEICELVV